ncbi:MAG: PilX N-terminal domain-containing pilus assembly protein [Pseudomonadota bacterium]
MRSVRAARPQRGITLIVGLIMVVLITLIVVNAFNLSSSNLKSVGNMQVRDEATAAANQAIEQLISSFSTASLSTQTFSVDLNKDGTTDYTVNTEAPTCMRRETVGTCTVIDCNNPSASGCGQSYQGTTTSTVSACGTVIVDWDIRAIVTDANTGAKVTVREGVRIPVNSSTANTWCS